MKLPVFPRRLNAIGLFALIVFLLSACGGGGGSNPVSNTPATATYTVLVYIVGSDLESKSNAGSADLAEMRQVGSSANMKVVVATGGANKDGWRSVKRRLINAGSETELSDLGNLNMGNPNTLQEFITWATATYPADKYALVMWDHGGGAIGSSATGTFGYDENHNNDALSLPEIKQALQNAYNTTGKKFDLIGFDACLMATLETAHTVSPYANYLVASEELEPGHGWDYASILSAIKSTPGISGRALGQIIADGYKAHNLNIEPSAAPSITLSVTDLSKIPSVITALESLATSTGAALQNTGQAAWEIIAGGRSKAEDYGNDEQNKSFTDMVDLKHLANNLAATYPTEANALVAAINQAVVYKINGAARPNANGLTVFMPDKNINGPGLAGMVQAYDAINFSPTYKSFVSQYANLGNQDATAPTFTSESFISNVYSAQVQGSDIANVSAAIFQVDSNTGTFIVLGIDSVDVSAGGNVTYPWHGQWLTMDGNFVSLNLEYEDTSIAVYTIPALLNGRGVNIEVMFDAAGNYSILGAWPGIQNGIAAREIITINSGDVITPLFMSYNVGTDAYDFAQGAPFTVGVSGLQLGIAALPPGTYNLSFIAEDYAQNMQVSQPETITVP